MIMDLESMIRNQEAPDTQWGGRQDDTKIVSHIEKKLPDRYKSSDNGGVFDFISMLASITEKSVKQYGVVFELDEGRRIVGDPNKKISNSHITYQVVSRGIYDNELKERVREVGEENNRHYSIYGQKFEAVVQLNIFSPQYEEAEYVMNRIEELISNYAGSFVKKGIVQVLFHNQLTDSQFDIYREMISVRNIQYKIVYERQKVAFSEEIDSIEIV